MFFVGLWERPSPLYCRPPYNLRPLIIWEADMAPWEEGAAKGLPVTGMIDPKVVEGLGNQIQDSIVARG
jgi:hypothetical protein